MRLSLNREILLFIFPIIVIPLIFLGIATLKTTVDNAQQRIHFSISNHLEQQQQQVETYFSLIDASLTLYTRDVVLNEYMQNEHEPALSEIFLEPLLENFSNFALSNPDYALVRLIKANGGTRVRHMVNVDALLMSDAVDEKDIIPLLNADTRRIHIFMDEDQQLKMLAIAPLRQESRGEQILWGHLVIDIIPNMLFKVMQKSLGNTGVSMFMSNQGELLLANTIIQEAQEKLELDMLGRLEQGVVEFLELPLKDKEFLAGVVGIAQSYLLVSMIDKDVFFSDIQDLFILTTVVILLIIFLVPFFTYKILSRLIVEPIDQLIAANEEVGRGNLEYQLDVSRTDEFGDLYTAHNAMIGQLKDYQKRLQNYNQELEEKVKDRTHQLVVANEHLENARNDAEKASEMKSQFLANMSHEIRTPLTAIVGFSEHAMDKNVNAIERHEVLNSVLKSGEHLLSLIDDILDVTKIETGHLQMEYLRFNLFEHIEYIDSLMGAKAREKGLYFKVDYQFPLPKVVESDPTRIRQILINLCSNAIKFTNEGGITLKISFDSESHNLQFVVSDTGIGLSEEEIERVFKPFVQADSSTTRKFGGTGLGLTICKYLAAKLGGDICATANEKQGAEFTVRIKSLIDSELVDKVFVSETQESIIEEQLDFGGANVLVAEDNPANQKLVQLLVRKMGIEPVIVSNGQEAFESVMSNDFDLVLMDMQMPVMGGMEATELLRASGIGTPIIALTANCMENDIANYLDAGCDSALSKPINNKLFFETISQYLTQNSEVSGQIAALTQRLESAPQIKQLQLEYFNSLEAAFTRMQELNSSQKLHELAQEAHSMKGAAGSMGFPELTTLAGALEVACRNEVTSDIDSALKDLLNHWQTMTNPVDVLD